MDRGRNHLNSLPSKQTDSYLWAGNLAIVMPHAVP